MTVLRLDETAPLDISETSQISRSLYENSDSNLDQSALELTYYNIDDRCESLRQIEKRRSQKSNDSIVNKKLRISLLNCQTLLDTKVPELDILTKDDHLQFFTDLNFKSKEHFNIVTSDIDYGWVVIKEHADKNIKQRIGMRYHRFIASHVKVDVIEEDYLVQLDRPARDKSAVQ